MHRAFDDLVSRILIEEICGFQDHYFDLLEIYEGDLDAEILVMELADLVADLLVTRRDDQALEQCAEAVEQVAQLQEQGEGCVLDFFLAELPAAALDRLRPLLGPHTAALARVLESRREADRALSSPQRRR